MKRVLASILLILPVAGCGTAKADPFDSSDDVNCVAAFSAVIRSSASNPASQVADELRPRVAFIAANHGGTVWLETKSAQTTRATSAMEAANDRPRIMRLLGACMARQDADPAFRKANPNAIPGSALVGDE